MIQAVRQVWRNPYVRILIGIVVVVLLYRLLSWSREVWGSLLIAYLIAFVLHPVITWFEHRRLPRSLGVVVVGVGLLLLLAGLWFLGIQVAAQLSLFVDRLPQFSEQLSELPFLISRRIDPSYGSTFQQVFQNLTSVALNVTGDLLPSLSNVRGDLLGNLSVVTGTGIRVMAVLFLSIYLLYSFRRYNRSFLRAFPERYRPMVAETLDRLGYAIGGYIRGQLVIALCVGILTGVGLMLLRIPLAIGLGVLAGVGNLIPFVGPILASVPTFMFGFTQGWLHALGAVGVLVLVNLIDANLLTPLVYSRVISLDPVTVILAILFGSVLFGVWGALAAVPAAVFFTLLYKDYYLTSSWYRDSHPQEVNPPEEMVK